MNAFLDRTFELFIKDIHLRCKTVKPRNSFSLKHLSMATGNFWIIVASALQCYVCLQKLDTGYSQRKYSENFIG